MKINNITVSITSTTNGLDYEATVDANIGNNQIALHYGRNDISLSDESILTSIIEELKGLALGLAETEATISKSDVVSDIAVVQKIT